MNGVYRFEKDDSKMKFESGLEEAQCLPRYNQNLPQKSFDYTIVDKVDGEAVFILGLDKTTVKSVYECYWYTKKGFAGKKLEEYKKLLDDVNNGAIFLGKINTKTKFGKASLNQALKLGFEKIRSEEYISIVRYH